MIFAARLLLHVN